MRSTCCVRNKSDPRLPSLLASGHQLQHYFGSKLRGTWEKIWSGNKKGTLLYWRRDGKRSSSERNRKVSQIKQTVKAFVQDSQEARVVRLIRLLLLFTHLNSSCGEDQRWTNNNNNMNGAGFSSLRPSSHSLYAIFDAHNLFTVSGSSSRKMCVRETENTCSSHFHLFSVRLLTYTSCKSVITIFTFTRGRRPRFSIHSPLVHFSKPVRKQMLSTGPNSVHDQILKCQNSKRKEPISHEPEIVAINGKTSRWCELLFVILIFLSSRQRVEPSSSSSCWSS